MDLDIRFFDGRIEYKVIVEIMFFLQVGGGVKLF